MRRLALCLIAIVFAIALNCEMDKTPTANTNTAFLRIVHIAADPALSVVDVYINGEKSGLLDNFPYGSISSNIEIPAATSAAIVIANQNSSSATDQSIASFNTTPLQQGNKYIAVITGVANPANFANPDPGNRNITLQFHLISNVRENSVDASVVDLLVFHGSTDAPSIDILANGVTPPLIDNLNFGDQTGSYISVDPTLANLSITPANDNSTRLSSFKPNLANLAGKTAFLFVSGFLDASQNQNGPTFKLFIGGANVAGGKLNESKLDYSQITDIEYSKHVQPIFQANCVSCHSASNASRGLKLDSWDNLIKGSDDGEAVIPFDSENSLLIEMLTKLVNGPHPQDQGADLLSDDAVEFLARWIDEGAKNDNGEVPYENSTNRLYVCNQAPGVTMVSIIDSKALVVIRNIKLMDLGFNADAKPHHIAIEPDGSHWYVSLIGQNKILKFDAQNQLVAESDNYSIPALLALDPVHQKLFISRFMDPANPLSAIVVLNSSDLTPAAGTAQGIVNVNRKTPHSMVINHSRSMVYSASLAESWLIEINAQTNDVENLVDIGNGKGPLQITVSPDDQELYISCQVSNQMLVFDTGTQTVVDSIAVGNGPWHPSFTPDGSHVYVGNNLSSDVSVINTSTRTVEQTITGNGIADPHGIAVTNNSKYVFVSSRNTSGTYMPRYDLGDNHNIGTVVVIDTQTNTIAKVIEIEEFGSGMGIWEQ